MPRELSEKEFRNYKIHLKEFDNFYFCRTCFMCAGLSKNWMLQQRWTFVNRRTCQRSRSKVKIFYGLNGQLEKFFSFDSQVRKVLINEKEKWDEYLNKYICGQSLRNFSFRSLKIRNSSVKFMSRHNERH